MGQGYSNKDQPTITKQQETTYVSKFEQIIKEKIELSLQHNNNSTTTTILQQNSEEIKKTSPINLIFDTDIGSDIDDALALLSLLHLPKESVNIIGVTTVYGFVELRSEISRKIINAHKIDMNDNDNLINIPVVTGSNYPMNEPVVLPCWQAHTEGIGIFPDEEIIKFKELQNCFLERKELENIYSKEAAKFIVEKAKELNGDLTIVCLGALTNVAMALELEKNLPNMVNKIVFMGGGVVPYHEKTPVTLSNLEKGKEYHCHSCHNIRQDQFAASIVFNAGFNIYCVGHTVTHELWFENEIVEEMRTLSFHRGTDPYINDNIIEEYNDKYLKATSVVGTLLDVWLKHRTCAFRKEIKGTCPHDALTTYEAIYLEKFIEYAPGHFVVNDIDGKTCFIYDPINGKAHVGISFRDGMVDNMINLLKDTMMRSITKDELVKYGLE
ncbi:hypothetical protein ABK040_009599 [Willaertia magna]